MAMQTSSLLLRRLKSHISSSHSSGRSHLRGLDLAILPRQLVRASCAGVACGLVIRCYRELAEESRKILYYSLSMAVAGTIIGGVYALVARRRHTSSFVYLFPLSAGVSASVVTGLYLSIRTVLHHQADIVDIKKQWEFASYFRSLYRLSLASGLVTGFLVSACTFRRVRDVLFASMLGGCFGLVGQLSYDAIQTWRRQKAIELYYKEHVDSTNDVQFIECVDGDAMQGELRQVWGQRFVEMAQSKSYAGQLKEKIHGLEEAIKMEQDAIDELESANGLS